MKLLDIMKRYDRCLVRESAKLTKIYNMILRESEADKDLAEKDDLSEEYIEVDELYGDNVNEKECENDVANECDKNNPDLIPEADFIKTEKELEEDDLRHNLFHNGHRNNPSDNPPRAVISEEDFFGEAEEAKEAEEKDTANKNDNAKDKSDKSSEEFMSAEEFFAEAENEMDEADNEIAEAEFEITPNSKMLPVVGTLLEKDDETKMAEDENKLQESLKSYRRKNHRLFNS